MTHIIETITIICEYFPYASKDKNRVAKRIKISDVAERKKASTKPTEILALKFKTNDLLAHRSDRCAPS